MIDRPSPILPPSRRERFTLRLMILLGACSMIYLLYCLLNKAQIGYAPFYWILMAGLVFNCLTILHEWYHYFSISVPETPETQHPFTVDIFTTFCPGEPYAMIVETLTAIQAITYPHTTYLCDEANDPYLIEVCKQLGVKHVTRFTREDAKAGNINNALKQATGELCVVMDPDHVPSPDFLDVIVSHFNNPEVGFVQIVQAYSNLGDSLVAKGAAQQTFQFYGPIMATMNSYGTVLAIGANCTFRRAALDSIGGHASGLAEDMHTAMQLHAKGWKSVYVPAVLTRGLVPATMSAYYAQQLKWARGTLELLVTSYPKLFRSFTWRQRLHYGTIPFHYLSGIVFFINFLIPVLSLFTGLIPLRVDFINFALLGLPTVTAIILIRHFVQRWVMEETERGFHVVGGLLLIGTWWIYILGLVYTVIRKKVPYIPTPKDDSGADNWQLNIPNILVLLTSLAAIVYGLSYDWNPYSLVMAGIAGVNCLIMMFNIIASLRLRRLAVKYHWLRIVLIYPLLLKKQLWLFRHLHLYAAFRKLGLPLLLAIVVLTGYMIRSNPEPAAVVHPPTQKQKTFYTGIFSPDEANGLTAIQQVKDYQQQFNARFNIISLYLPWGDAPQCNLPDSLIAAIYNNGSLPMITWEPWTSLFENAALHKEQKVFARISAGAFDEYLLRFAARIKSLNRPVYLRFAHEADNPAYPWSQTGNNTPEEFKAAWRYVYDLFQRNGAGNVIWVWNPWRAAAATEYFPGTSYVDWIGVTGLNYGPQNENGQSYAFRELYAPFHQLPVFRSGLPVMVAEMGSLTAAGNQQLWLNDAFNAIDHSFSEIHAFILFNSDQDKNVLRPVAGDKLNWKLQEPGKVFAAAEKYTRIRESGKTIPYGNIIATPPSGRATAAIPLPDSIRGINYQKGENWFRNLHALTRREITKDFAGMKALGANTIRRFGPGVYDRNILHVAKELDINIHYGFWIPAITDMDKDAAMLSDLRKTILHRVAALKHDRSIVAWNIGGTVWQQLSKEYFKPELLYQQQNFITWLGNLMTAIKAIDATRPLTIDVAMNSHIAGDLEMLHQQLPQADAFGIVMGNDTTGLSQLASVTLPHYFSQIPVAAYAHLPGNRQPAFITSWQDLETRDYVTFDGLTDHWGRYKSSFYQLGYLWSNTFREPAIPRIHILRPARTTYPDDRLTYHALIYNNNEWKPAANNAGVKLEWYLVKTDGDGNNIFLRKLGKGAFITISIPENPEHYRLYLEAVKDDHVATVQSKLNTPL
ncbi:Glycosyltransferase, catalytic subunit of cellulose synthase and poly-beta-1,6-N-acetylglucosamine synthase [Chitinophaga ginsengisegetis]|uniref:Glycosyltransferase, catalytic subunit of cellulose synthase and poly-beta-1,6-N-acetylglucosamine synthase n=1 Tax=Chitinophaga ginsengisegetis TaxID=393003 RepID=A0A1T5PB06_9BACT|nr:glycosyltransferase family 2 protein [Chitinophaga ginsengisegetis]SKD09783.1 Glycosyltransferase, catalytic subunit of cellulose synthase and poly-beta-1,6-N-acetylglucosamine synthase [Chitinophaga ginsengisegetis]